MIRRTIAISHRNIKERLLSTSFNLPKTSTRVETSRAGVSGKGLYGVPELTSPLGFRLLTDKVFMDAQRLVEEVTDAHRKRSILFVFDDLSNTICLVADMAECIRLTHPDKVFVDAAEECVQQLQRLVESLNTNRDLYDSLCRAMSDLDPSTSQSDAYVLQLFKMDFETSGVQLPSAKRKQFVNITQDVFSAQSDFVRGTESASVVPGTLIPEHLKRHFERRLSADEDVFLVDERTLCNAASAEVRALAYKLYYRHSPAQESALLRLLNSRRQLAHLTEFASFAHRTLRGTLIETPERATQFLEMLASALKPRAQKDLTKLNEEFAAEVNDKESLPAYDVPIMIEKTKQKLYGISYDSLKPYLSLPSVLNGLNSLLNDLYGLSLVEVETQPGEVWTDDVRKLAVQHESDGLLGFVYCDFFNRPGKFAETHFTIRGGRTLDKQLPIVTLSHSFRGASRNGDTPTLQIGQVENLFHEFGHALHSILGQTKYQHTTGTRCSTDFAEIPSNLMEYFALDPRVSERYMRHTDSGQVLANDSRLRIHALRTHMLAIHLLQQCLYALFDLKLHTEFDPSGRESTTDLFLRLQRKLLGVSDDAQTLSGLCLNGFQAWQHRFAHLGPYGSKYYAYLLAHAVASLLWQHLFRENPFSRNAGEKYRKMMLAFGGEKAPMTLIEGVLGFSPEQGHLVEALLRELEDSE